MNHDYMASPRTTGMVPINRNSRDPPDQHHYGYSITHNENCNTSNTSNTSNNDNNNVIIYDISTLSDVSSGVRSMYDSQIHSFTASMESSTASSINTYSMSNIYASFRDSCVIDEHQHTEYPKQQHQPQQKHHGRGYLPTISDDTMEDDTDNAVDHQKRSSTTVNKDIKRVMATIPTTKNMNAHRNDGHNWMDIVQVIVNDNNNIMQQQTNVTPILPVVGTSNAMDDQKNTDVKVNKSSKKPKDMDKNVVYTQPTVSDVLFGRGQHITLHPGNRKYLQYRDGLFRQYTLATTNKMKKETVNKLISRVYANNGRFLEPVVVKVPISPTSTEAAATAAARHRSKNTAATNSNFILQDRWIEVHDEKKIYNKARQAMSEGCIK